MESVVLVLFLLFCICFLGYFIIDLINNSVHSIDTYAHIVDFKRVDRKHYNSYIPVIEYSIDNKTYCNEANFIRLSEEAMNNFNKDKLISVTVDKEDPNKFIKTKHYTDGLFGGLFFGFFHGVLISFLFAYLYFNTYFIRGLL